MPLQLRTEKVWADKVLFLLKRAGQTQANLADKVGIHATALHHYLHGTRHAPIDVVHRINSAMGDLLANGADFQGKNITAYFESLIVDSIREPAPDYNVAADADGGFALGFGLVEPYLRAGARTEITQAWHDAGGPVGLLYDVNRAWRQEVIRSVDGTVPQKLFIDVISAIFEKHGISLQKWFKDEAAIRKHRALENIHLVTRKSLARTGATIALRNELEATIIMSVLNYINADEHNHDLFELDEGAFG